MRILPWSRSPDPEGRDIILTGIPRSGTTLCCHLLNEIPGVVALHESMNVAELTKDRSPRARCKRVSRFFNKTRREIIRHGRAPSKTRQGVVPDNHVTDEVDEQGLRIARVEYGHIRVDPAIGNTGRIVLKHPNAFSAIVDELATCFPTFAVVRNPLSLLGSWNSVRMNFSQGRAPAAERLDSALADRLGRIDDPVIRQVELLSWYYEQYARHLRPEAVIRYEDVIASGGTVLQVIVPEAAALRSDLSSRNRSNVYSREVISELADEILMRPDGGWWHYYERRDVQGVRDAMAGGA